MFLSLKHYRPSQVRLQTQDGWIGNQSSTDVGPVAYHIHLRLHHGVNGFLFTISSINIKDVTRVAGFLPVNSRSAYSLRWVLLSEIRRSLSPEITMAHDRVSPNRSKSLRWKTHFTIYLKKWKFHLFSSGSIQLLQRNQKQNQSFTRQIIMLPLEQEK